MSLVVPEFSLLPIGPVDPRAPGACTDPRCPDTPVPVSSLRELAIFRGVSVAGQAIAITVALLLDVALSLAFMTALVVLQLVANAVSWRRTLRRGTVASREVFAMLTFDVACFTGLLAMAGGANNPFALFFILYLALFALLLPPRWAIVGGVVIVAMAAAAAILGRPLRLVDGHLVSEGVMAGGRAASFLLVLVSMGWCVGRVTSVLRLQDRLLREAAKRNADDDTMVRIGALAAGAAHELGTPLTTMTIIVDEWRKRTLPPWLERDAAILASQIAACRDALAGLRAAAGHARVEPGAPQTLDRFLAANVDRCRALHPALRVTADFDGIKPPPEIFAEPTLAQAILILLNNAADASPHEVRVTGRWTAETLELEIADRGPGIPAAMLGRLGRTFFTTKPPGRGTGLGLVLTSSTLDRLGGSIRWRLRDGGGTVVEVKLPLFALLPPSPQEKLHAS